MPTPSNVPLRSLSFCLASAALAVSASAQVPDGTHVTSCLKVNGSPWPGNGGVFVSHPRDAGTLTPITGLPESITYASDVDPGAVGANCVLIDRSIGGVIVGTNGRAGEVLDLHRITLDGLNATQVDLYELGTLVANGGGVFELDWIDDDEVIAAVGAINGAAGSPATVQIARVDFTSGVVAAVDLRGFSSSGFINAIAYDAAIDTVYFGVGGFPSGNSEIHSFTLGGVDAPALVTTLAGALRNLAVDAAGDVIAGLAVAPASGDPVLVRVTPGGGNTTLLSSIDNVNAFAIEPTSGQFAIVGQNDRTDPFTYGAYFFDGDSGAGGAASQLAIERDSLIPAGPLTGVDAAPAPVAYGDPSGFRDYAWSDEQAPSRFAVAGQPWDAIVDWPDHASPLFGKYLVAGASRDPVLPGIGIDVLIDARRSFLSGGLVSHAGALQSSVDLDLPGALKGETIFLQAFFFEFGGISATPGLRITIQ
ncbi:MAG: hypothetical protein AAF957_10675 [Planctomycetota bacterium]